MRSLRNSNVRRGGVVITALLEGALIALAACAPTSSDAGQGSRAMAPTVALLEGIWFEGTGSRRLQISSNGSYAIDDLQTGAPLDEGAVVEERDGQVFVSGVDSPTCEPGARWEWPGWGMVGTGKDRRMTIYDAEADCVAGVSGDSTWVIRPIPGETPAPVEPSSAPRQEDNP